MPMLHTGTNMPMLHRGDGQRVRVEKRPPEWCVNAMDPTFAGGILSDGCSGGARTSLKQTCEPS